MLITFVTQLYRNMNQRLQQFLAAENISQAQFADTIDVARASVSHVIAGRNNPGYDFIRNLALHYPDLNLEWLICGKGRMYKSATPSEISPELPPEPENAPEAPQDADEPILQEPAPPVPPAELKAVSGRGISRIVIFYDDNTYQELK